jgi:hypothetical protein
MDLSGQQEPLLLLDVPTLQRPVLDVSYMYVHYRGSVACGLQQEPLLLIDLPTLQRSVLHLAVSTYTPQGPELHLDLSGQQELLLLLDVSSLLRPLLHDVSTCAPQGLSCTWTWRSFCCSWTCLHYKGLFCTLTCLQVHYRGISCTWTCQLQRPVLHLAVSTCTVHHRGLCCTWTCQDNRSLCCSWMCLHL